MQRHSTEERADDSVAYSLLRFSTPAQAKGDSWRRQTEPAKEWSQRNKIKLDTSLWLFDPAVSAFTGKQRENPDKHALAAFLKMVEKGIVKRGSYLVIENLDRLSREDLDEAVQLLLGLTSAGIRIVQLQPAEMVFQKPVNMTALILAIVELSRGNSESRIKSERVGQAWQEKKACAREGKPQPSRKEARVNGMSLMTHCLPAWIKERDGKPELIPERAAVVKRIFHLAANGYGTKMIVRKFIEEGVPPIGRNKSWNRTYIMLILKDRRAVGEHQPMRRRKANDDEQPGKRAIPDGDAIPGYFPSIVTEQEWLAARAGVNERKVNRGRTGEAVVNPFAGLLKNARQAESYHVAMRQPSKGSGKPEPVLLTNSSTEGRGPAFSFPFRTFEAAILSCLKEIDPHEILNGGEPDESLALSQQYAGVESELAEAAAFMEANGFSATIGKRVTALEDKKRELAEKLTDARQKAAHPASESWGEAKGLLATLDAAPDPRDARLRLRSALRRIISSIYVLVVPRGKIRLAQVMLLFSNGTFRGYFMIHKPAISNGKRRTEGAWVVDSFLHPDDSEQGLSFLTEDLRDGGETGHDVELVRESLEALPMDMIEHILRTRGQPIPS